MADLLLSAAAGTGKSEYLVQLAGELFHDGTMLRSRKIIALSFKRNAADDLYRRMICRYGKTAEERFDSYTFDGFAKELLDRFGKLLPDFWRPSPDYDVIPELLDPQNVHDIIFEAVWDKYHGFDVEEVAPWNFCRRFMTAGALPADVAWRGNINDDLGLYVWQYLLKSKPSLVNFSMINALAELLLRLNPQVRQALCDTYGYIFLDEFQDTTFEQYELFKTAFKGSKIPVIAAGDEEQRIMLWANAMPDAFEIFKRDFTAEEVTLTENFRSEPLLVALQNQISCGNQNKCIARLTSFREECRGFVFASAADEADFILKKVRNLLCNSYHPRDIAILVRNSGSELSSILCRNPQIRVRDESKLHKLLTEPVIDLLFTLWDAAFTGDWAALNKISDFMTAVSGDERREIQRAAEFLQRIKKTFSDQIFSIERFSELLAESITFIGESRIKAGFPRYRQGNWLEDCLKQLRFFAEELMNDQNLLTDELFDFRHGHFVTLTTIQQCKMREFKVVFAAELEKADLMHNFIEESSGLFIACSRAKEKVFFTASEEFGKLSALYDFFEKRGIVFTRAAEL